METIKSLGNTLMSCIRSYPKSILAGSTVLALIGRSYSNSYSICIKSDGATYRLPKKKHHRMGKIFTALSLAGIAASLSTLLTAKPLTQLSKMVRSENLATFRPQLITLGGFGALTTASLIMFRSPKNSPETRLSSKDLYVLSDLKKLDPKTQKQALSKLRNALNSDDDIYYKFSNGSEKKLLHKVAKATAEEFDAQVSQDRWKKIRLSSIALCGIGLIGMTASLVSIAWKLRGKPSTPSLPIDGGPTTPALPLIKPKIHPKKPVRPPIWTPKL